MSSADDPRPRRFTLAVLQLLEHPYFETRDGWHAHLVFCRACRYIALQAGDLQTCQICDAPLLALDLDLMMHMDEDSFYTVEP